MKAARWRAERPLPLLKQSAAAVASMALQRLLRQLFVEALFYLDNQCYGPEKGAHLKCLAPTAIRTVVIVALLAASACACRIWAISSEGYRGGAVRL